MSYSKVKTSALTGILLDYAAMKADGTTVTDEVFIDELRMFKYHHATTGRVRYSSNWAIGGSIIERERITLRSDTRGGLWVAFLDADKVTARQKGTTPLIAAMRCHVASKLGDTVEIPTELMKD